MHLDMKIIQVHACTKLQIFMAAIFFQFCPLGTCIIPKFMMIYDAKEEKSKHARIFMQKVQMLMQRSNENERNSNMQWSKSNMR